MGVFFSEGRRHAPTMIVSHPLNATSCSNVFSPEEFWQPQHDMYNSERYSHHKGVSMNLFAVWCEKLIFVEAVARLNPFNTSTFAWMDSGIARNSMRHLYRNSIVRIDATAPGSKLEEHAVLLNQVHRYEFNETQAYNPISPSGKVIVAGGSMYFGTPLGFDNLYSAYYDVVWSMALQHLFTGEDQVVMYRTCHTFPSACHIHKPRRMYQWNAMITQILTGLDENEAIAEPLKLGKIEPKPKKLPAPPIRVTIAKLPNITL